MMPEKEGIHNYCPCEYKCLTGKRCALKHICHVPRPEKKKEDAADAQDNGS